MTHRLRAATALLALLAMLPAQAHEFWMLPSSFVTPQTGATSLTLSVGENFTGEQVGIYAGLIASARHYFAGQVLDIRARVPADRQIGELLLPLPRTGTHLVAFDTNPSEITLPADKFHEYLRMEGLDAVIRKREAAGMAGAPGRERYRRNVKTLIQVGSTPDATHSVRTGQRLEIVPLANPYAAKPGDSMEFQIMFEGKPLRDALLKAWTKQSGRTVVANAVSDAQGKLRVALTGSGTWMVSVVHMVPATDSPAHDWDSYWGNLTFAVPEAGRLP